MTLQTGGDVRFKIRPIEGAPSFGNQTPAVLVLDGQQRLTSLYQVLRSGHVVATTDKRKKPIERWFYIDIAAAVDEEADFEEIIVTVDSSKRRIGFDRTVEVDVSTPEAEWAAGLFHFRSSSTWLDATSGRPDSWVTENRARSGNGSAFGTTFNRRSSRPSSSTSFL